MKENSYLYFKRAIKRLSGDEVLAHEALKKVHAFYAPDLYITAKKFMKSPLLAEILVNHVFTTIWRDRKQLDGVDDFNQYVLGVVKKVAFGMIRRNLHEERIRRKQQEMARDWNGSLPVERVKPGSSFSNHAPLLLHARGMP